MSAYLIIINLINIYEIPFIVTLSDKNLGFTSTALSILILIYSQFENAMNYSIKSEKFHQCSLEIAELYNELRMVKTSRTLTEKEQEEKINQISKQYDIVLRQHENHLPIDNKDFLKTKPEYFELNKVRIWRIYIEKYFRVYFAYHLFIYGPIIWFILYQVKNIYLCN